MSEAVYTDIKNIEKNISDLIIDSKLDSVLDIPVADNKFVKKINIKEFQDAIHELESRFSNNCCQSDDIMACQTDGCQSCQNSCRCQSAGNQSCQNACYCQSPTNQSCQNACYCQSSGNQACQSNCVNCASDCCVAEGTLVICYVNSKYILKSIENIQSGDIVVGANGQLNEVYARTDTILGSQRAMFTFADHSLYFTGEHAMWARYGEQEYFGIHDISSYYREKAAMVNGKPILEWEQEETYKKNNIIGKPISKGLSKEPMFVLFTAEYGTDKGWKFNQAMIAKDKIYTDETPVHTLIVGGNHTYFANGYLVSGFATDADYDYDNIKIEDLKLGYEKI